jgi:hypothetical protein
MKSELTPPPPSATLLEAARSGGRVTTRRPALQLLLALVVGAGWAAAGLLVFKLRVDLGALPMTFVAGVGALWLLAFAAPLVLLLLPPRRQVLPEPRRALVAAALGGAMLVAVSVFATASAPGVSLPIPPGAFWALAAHCTSIALAFSAGTFAVAALLLRRLVPSAGVAAGVATGISSGSAGGLLLHFICPFADAGHVTAGHAGAALACAAIGGIVALSVGKMRK